MNMEYDYLKHCRLMRTISEFLEIPLLVFLWIYNLKILFWILFALFVLGIFSHAWQVNRIEKKLKLRVI